ncbi:hypothetical protein LV89_01010 [Arcicella aurantiaca]|uniref:Lipoprotein n=1 Tax=Arcicella aurantiaca TaxID=591202 RepID=A0A316EFN8_9BACT|nr:hypothetical protein [Arcicella aurantiaca]PWK28229.1 hypothetical protein LV89_01010 [Arcicella aurantiaca]
MRYLILITIALLITSCTTPCDTLQEKITDAIKTDKQITSESIITFKTFILNNKEDFKDCQPDLIVNDAVNDNSLLSLIKKNELYIKVSKKKEVRIALTGEQTIIGAIIPKLYLESSGSMFFYDKPNGDGQFKTVITSLLNNFDVVSPEANKIYVVNDKVYPIDRTFTDLAESNDIFKYTKGIGNPNFTDFNKIFKTILNDLSEGEVSIMFSDLIYSTPNMTGKKDERIVIEAQQLTENVFHDYAQDYSVLVLKFNGDYDGKYYAHNAPPFEYRNKTRPYYVSIFAKNATMKKFLEDDNYKVSRDWVKYTGFENFHLFSNNVNLFKPYYTVLLHDKDNEGDIEQDDDEVVSKSKVVKTLQNVRVDSDSKKLTINVLVDLSKLYLPNEIKEDINNYKVECTQPFVLDKITPIKHTDGTHKFTLSSSRNVGGKRDLYLKFKRNFPPKWIEESNTIHDQSDKIPNFEHTTYGIKNMLGGIDRAYNPNQEEYFYKITLQLNN